MSSFGYFTEIEILQNKIKQLEEQLNDEREEHKAIYAMMKRNLEDCMQEMAELKKEKQRLVLHNTSLIAFLENEDVE